jgi:hypothetical protein
MKIVINGNDNVLDEIRKKYKLEFILVGIALYAVGRKISKREKEITRLTNELEELKSKGE